MFDTQKCDFGELQRQLDQVDFDKQLAKFDFQQMIQTLDNVDDFPDHFYQFLESNIENDADV